MAECAPVAVLAYNRPQHLRNTLTSLMQCKGFGAGPLLVFFDGPRDESERPAVNETRDIARSMLGDSAEYFYAEENMGLASSVISAVDTVVARFGKVIVIEDDLKLHPGFLDFMNLGLMRYQNDERVWQISGYMFDVPEMKNETNSFFLPLTVSWGWATWRRAWDLFDAGASGWEALKTDRQLRKRFNFGNAYDYATMLERQMAGLRDSWAIRWYWTVFKANGLVLFPPKSFVSNIGFDGSGTHGRGVLSRFSTEELAAPDLEVNFPASIQQNELQTNLVSRGIRKQSGGWIARVGAISRRLLNR